MIETTKMIKAIANDSKVRIDRIVENYEQLEKENAELKERVDNLYNSDCWASDQLTKAKNLLAKWVELYKPKSKTALPTPIQVDTEQFISEVEK